MDDEADLLHLLHLELLRSPADDGAASDTDDGGGIGSLEIDAPHPGDEAVTAHRGRDLEQAHEEDLDLEDSLAI